MKNDGLVIPYILSSAIYYNPSFLNTRICTMLPLLDSKMSLIISLDIGLLGKDEIILLFSYFWRYYLCPPSSSTSISVHSQVNQTSLGNKLALQCWFRTLTYKKNIQCIFFIDSSSFIAFIKVIYSFHNFKSFTLC